MGTRRDFLKQAALLSAAGALGGFPGSIRRAYAIEPERGSSFLDAEHVVVLMQENRSFDHAFGTLRGVRGFGDPRAIRLPDGMPVWAQANEAGERFVPFRLGMFSSRATWMGALPHGWADQVDARNNGRFDQWLKVKQSGHDAYRKMPLTLGYYTREDLPFYHALADAFTVCDQNFCSSLTGTTPNRLHLWTGTVRAEQRTESPALIYNSDVDYGRWASWKTFPERMQELGVSWRVYQNELSIESGLKGEHDGWLANFTDNPLEWFSQYGVRFSKSRRSFVAQRIAEITADLNRAELRIGALRGDHLDRARVQVTGLRTELDRLRAEAAEFTEEAWERLDPRARELHERAFASNRGDPDFRSLAEMVYRADDGSQRSVQVPKGDILRNFRSDVESGRLPTVSWLVPPERVSDHPTSAWYGAWYLSEVMDILTSNPEVWKKTVFILTYDENDGYFDHFPPFVAPDPSKPGSGVVSEGIDAGLEIVSLEQDRAMHGDGARGGPIGLGYRVPMVIASPWTRGGYVCSQVFDHTSVLQFLEKFLSHKTGRAVVEPNINRWRRTVCGDLTAAFGTGFEVSAPLDFLDRDEFVADIHRAQFLDPPVCRELTAEQIEELGASGRRSTVLPVQEEGVRPSRALPYELEVEGRLAEAGLSLRFIASDRIFGPRASGAAFVAYVRGHDLACRNYAVEAGRSVVDVIGDEHFSPDGYEVDVHGPNGFLRRFVGARSDPGLGVAVQRSEHAPGLAAQDLVLRLSVDSGDLGVEFRVSDQAYGQPARRLLVQPGRPMEVRLSVAASHGWYDVVVACPGYRLRRHFAGRVETGADSMSDPQLSPTHAAITG